MTFSLLLLDRKAGQIGVAIASPLPMIGSLGIFSRFQAGAVVVHPPVNPRIGRSALDHMEAGYAPNRALSAALTEDPNAELRQVHAMDFQGCVAAVTGSSVAEYSACTNGGMHSLAGTMMADEKVFFDLEMSIIRSEGLKLADRLVGFLEAGAAAGASKTPLRSACLKILSRETSGDIVLRADDMRDPIAEIGDLAKNFP